MKILAHKGGVVCVTQNVHALQIAESKCWKLQSQNEILFCLLS